MGRVTENKVERKSVGMGTHGGESGKGMSENRWIRLKDAREKYSINYRTLRTFAQQANAWKKVGSIVYVDTIALDEYIAQSSEIHYKETHITDTTVKGMMLSEAFRSLTYRQKVLVFVAMQVQLDTNKVKPSKFGNLYGNVSDGDFFFTHNDVIEYGMYLTDEKGFCEDKKILANNGLLEVVSPGKYGSRTVYRLSKKWAHKERENEG